MTPWIAHRNKTMATLYADEGRSLDYIGKVFSVSRQRVHQILVQQGVTMRPKWMKGKLDDE